MLCSVFKRFKSNLDVLFGKNRARLMLLPVQIYRLYGMHRMGMNLSHDMKQSFFVNNVLNLTGCITFGHLLFLYRLDILLLF